MTRETKIGLLVGMGVIILIGILISDHLSEAQRQEYAGLDRPVPELDEGDLPSPPGIGSDRGDDSGSASERTEPLKMPEELVSRDESSDEPEPSRRDRADDSSPEPFIIRHDVEVPPVTFRADQEEEPQSQPPSRPRTESRTPRRTGPSAEELGDQWVDVSDSAQPSTRRSGGGAPANDRTAASGRSEETEEQAVEVSEEIVHHVQKGETLSDIARKYYDDPNYWRRIQEANRDAVPDVSRLRAGVRLVIPNKAGFANAAAGRSRPAATEEYTVQSGESLSKIAGRYYDSVHEWRKLYELNEDRIADPNRLKPGTVIRVPRN